MTTPTATTQETHSLKAFREAAKQIRNASVIAQGQTLEITGAIALNGEFVTRFKLLGDEPFRSMAMSIRLVYMQGEPANFYHIASILHRLGSSGLRNHAQDCRARYKAAVEGKYVQFQLHGSFEGQIAGPKEVFEAWLYGIAFHQDVERRPLLEELSKYQDGTALPFSVHMIGLRIAGAILDLDDLVAEFLGEEPLPRIAPSA